VFKVVGRFNMQAEAGYVIDYQNPDNSDFINKRGMKFKLEERYYLTYFARHPGNFYLAAETYYNYINFDREQQVRECIDNNCEFPYIRTAVYVRRYREYGQTIKWGWIKYWGRFVMDLNTGWTLRFIQYSGAEPITGLSPEDVVFDSFDIPNEENRITIGPNLGIRLGYRFK
jgi:hypothetical protein